LRKALKKLEILVVQDSFMSDTALVADVVFGASTWSEKEGCYTNSERRCNYAQKAVEPLGDSKSDLDIVLEFSKYFEDKHELLFSDIKTPKDVFEEMKRVSKGRLCDYSGMDYEKIMNLGGIQWPCNDEYPNGKKRLYTDEMRCNSANGKANLIVADWIPLSEDISKGYPIMLNTGRTVEQFHTRTKTGTIGILDALAPEAWIDISPLDAKKLIVSSGDRISISSNRGVVDNLVVKITQTVREGSVFIPFHYNTQLINNVTLAEFDPKSFEPNYKQCAIQLHSSKKPHGIELKEVEISGYLEGVKVYVDEEIEIKEVERVG